MSINIDVEKMKELMKALYTMSGIRFVLFDNEYREITAYPREGCEFCRMMKANPKTRRKCTYADRRSFSLCEREDKPIIYNCHAGLVEAVIPLHDNEKIIGYLMFGQLSKDPQKTNLNAGIKGLCEQYGMDEASLKEAVDKITLKTEVEIDAASKIMEASASYIILKELITPSNNKLLEKAKAYIEENLSEEIEIKALSEACGIGRTRLYELFRSEEKQGVAEYIRRRRLKKAKNLLKTTELSIPEISETVGFADYNYFSRVFKSVYKKSPRHYRKSSLS